MSGILWREMVKQGMARSRTEAERLVRDKAVTYEMLNFSKVADHPEMEFPGRTVIRVGKHMFRCVPRLNGPGFDQLRGRIEIPVTPPEDENGCVSVNLQDVS